MVSLLGLEELKLGKFWLALMAEIIGTALLVNLAGGAGLGGASNIQTSLAAGFTVMTIVWCIVHVSGACINPAVSLALLATRKMSLTRAVFYVISECIGGVLGAATLYFTSPRIPTPPNAPPPTHSGPPGMAFMEWYQIVAVEMIITFFLLFTVFATIDRRRPGIAANDGSAVILIGLAVTVGHFWAGPLTGGVMNPAAAFGSAVLKRQWEHQWKYWLGEISGALLAGFLYEFVLAANASRAKLRAFFTRYDYDDSKMDETVEHPSKGNANHDLPHVEKQ